MKVHPTFIFILFTAGLTFGLSGLALAEKTPKSCHDGYNQLSSNKYKSAISSLTRCLKSRSLSNPSKATAYYNRAASYYLQSLKEKSLDKAYKYLDLALPDVEKSIQLDGSYGKAYCLRGQIWLEASFGEVGYDDLKKGLAKGAPAKQCQP